MSTLTKDMLAALTPKPPVRPKEGLHCIVYGEPKSGKTWTLDSRIRTLVLDLEGGDAVLAGAENVDIVPITSIEHLNAYGELLDKGKWITPEGKIEDSPHSLIAIDSITRLQDLVKHYVVNTLAPSRKREIAKVFGAQSDWGNFGTIITDLVKFFHNMTKRGDKSLNVMWLAHKENKYENPNAETQITGTQIKMQGGSVSVVMSIVDAIFYMEKLEKVNKETKQTNVHYFIRTEKTGITEAGVRYSKRDERLPKVIENPDWYEIFKTLGYKVEK